MTDEQLAEFIHETHQNLAPRVVEDWVPVPWEDVQPEARVLLIETAKHVKQSMVGDFAFRVAEALLELREDPEGWHGFVTIFNDRDESALRWLMYTILGTS
jgi:hypothetical protein